MRIALLVLALAGCAVDVAPGAPENTVWVEPTSPLYAAQQAWGLPLPAEARLIVVPPAVFFPMCDARSAEPCAASVTGFTVLEDSQIVMRSDLPANIVESKKRHELGHLLRGAAGHIEGEACPEGAPGAFLMCAWGDGSILEPSEADLDFVLGE